MSGTTQMQQKHGLGSLSDALAPWLNPVLHALSQISAPGTGGLALTWRWPGLPLPLSASRSRPGGGRQGTGAAEAMRAPGGGTAGWGAEPRRGQSLAARRGPRQPAG